MNKQTIKVPAGIRFLSEWPEFNLQDHPCIIDKKLTGCGFTEYVIRGDFNVVLISPRKILLENKSDQHNPTNPFGYEIPEQRVIYYAKTDKKSEIGIDKDLESLKPKMDKEQEDLVDYNTFKEELRKAIGMFQLYGKPIKLSVTYDSFRKVKEVLEELKIIDSFYFVVDEFQSIFTDSRFKPGTELEFVTALQSLDKVNFVSATPMIEDYLNEIDEFKDLPYYELDWESEDHGRIITPDIVAKPCRSINETAKKIVSDFKAGKYEKKALLDSQGNPSQLVEAKELVLYVNSIKNIADIIRQNKLMPEDVTVICANTDENKKKIREAFRVVFKECDRSIKELPSLDEIISKVPSPDKVTGEYHNKPITLCSKTVYLGADFYSKCARSIVLSDSGIESLAVDITLDLPQIMGRQRDIDNPWKNSLEIWFKLGMDKVTQEEFEAWRQEKLKTTEDLLSAYDTAKEDAKHSLALKYLKGLKTENYRDDYVAINQHNGSDLKPQKNQLVVIAEKRAYDIQQKDYKDRFTVFNTIEQVFGNSMDLSKDLQNYLNYLDEFSFFHDKMKAICYQLQANNSLYDQFLSVTPEPFRTYVLVLGINYILKVGGVRSDLEKALNSRPSEKIYNQQEIDNVIMSSFEIGDKINKSDIKTKLQTLYDSLGLVKKAKASDIEQWFEIKSISLYDSETKKRNAGYEILAQK